MIETLRPNKQRATNAMILIWIVLGLDVVSFISAFFQYNLLQLAAQGDYISMETATANDTREQIIAIVYMIVYIISGVIFIQWFRRAYFNLHLKVSPLAETEGWAAGAWFVPIVCIYKPYQIMKELYVETERFLTSKGIAMNERFSVNAVGWWWALWIIGSVMGQVAFRVSLNAESVDELTFATIFSMFGDLLCITMALITVKVIRDYSRLESLMAEVRDEEELVAEVVPV